MTTKSDSAAAASGGDAAWDWRSLRPRVMWKRRRKRIVKVEVYENGDLQRERERREMLGWSVTFWKVK